MDIAELQRLVQQQEQQLQQLAYQKHLLEQRLQQLQGNVDATYGSIQMLQGLLSKAQGERQDEELPE